MEIMGAVEGDNIADFVGSRGFLLADSYSLAQKVTVMQKVAIRMPHENRSQFRKKF